jgi:hypothetical protein
MTENSKAAAQKLWRDRSEADFQKLDKGAHSLSTAQKANS